MTMFKIFRVITGCPIYEAPPTVSLGQKKMPFLPDELWEEIKSLIYSESNGGGSTEGDRLGGASQC